MTFLKSRSPWGATAALLAIVLAFTLSTGETRAAQLYAWNVGGQDLYDLDTSGPSSVFIGGGNPSILSEIEFGGRIIYGVDTGNNNLLHEINPATGLFTNTTVMTFPPGGNVITALEFVGSTLYGGLTTEGGGGGPTILVTIDTASGIVTAVGPTGVNSPLGGLAYDGSTMYAISAGGSTPVLYTIALGTGTATPIGTVTLAGGPLDSATALEFGSDGALYALPNVQSPLVGNLLSIDPATAAATNLGPTGIPQPNTLTSPESPDIPMVTGWLLVALGLSLLAAVSGVILLVEHRRRQTVIS